jgi:Bacterial capsule synthesis protein PGA_cap
MVPPRIASFGSSDTAFLRSGENAVSPPRAGCRRTILPASLATVLLLAVFVPAVGAEAPPVRFAFTGDIAMVAGPAEDYFRAVRLDLVGDVVLGNLEGTLTERGSSKCEAGSTSCFSFRAPVSYAPLLHQAGFTIVNLANNHALDYGAVGEADTVAAVRKAGLLTTGRPGEIAYAKVRGTRVAVLGFAPYPWAQSLLNLPAAQALVRKADEWADLVVVTMHAGAEGSSHQHVRAGTERFLGENRGNSVAFAHAVVRAGADLVVGSGPHVLRGMEWYRGRLIAYSLGNLVGYHTLSTAGVSGVSAILQVALTPRGTWVAGELAAVTLAPVGIPRPDPAEAAHGVVRALSKQDFGRHAMLVSRAGVLSPPRR